MHALRSLMPRQIVRGAVVRADGIAVALVSGGAPPWDLLAASARVQAASDYHRLLLTLAAPLDVYVIDQPPDLAAEISTLLERQERALVMGQETQADVLGEIADYLTMLAQQGGSRAKQVLWAVTASGEGTVRGVGGLDLSSLLRGVVGRTRTTSSRPQLSTTERSALTRALEQARRLADGLAVLGGVPAPRLLEAEEIAQVFYQLADPVRAHRYPLAGALLDRVRRIVVVDPVPNEEPW